MLESAACCWIPIADLRETLNRLPGPQLTLTDVTQRLAALEEEEPLLLPQGRAPAPTAGRDRAMIASLLQAARLNAAERHSAAVVARRRVEKAGGSRKQRLRNAPVGRGVEVGTMPKH